METLWQKESNRLRVQYKVNDLPVGHFTGFEHAAFHGGVVVPADDIIAAELLGIDFDKLSIQQCLFAQEISFSKVAYIICTIRQRKEPDIKFGFIHRIDCNQK